MFDSLRAVSATFASLLCFLILASVVYSRHFLASVMFLHAHERAAAAPGIEVAAHRAYGHVSGLHLHVPLGLSGGCAAGEEDNVEYAAASSQAPGVRDAASAPSSGEHFDSYTKLYGATGQSPELALDEDGKLTFSTEYVTSIGPSTSFRKAAPSF